MSTTLMPEVREAMSTYYATMPASRDHLPEFQREALEGLDKALGKMKDRNAAQLAGFLQALS